MKDLEEKINRETRRLTVEDPRVRFDAVTRLTELALMVKLKEKRKIVERLGELVSDTEAFVRWNLAFAFGKIGHPAGITYLGKMARFDEHANVRFRVALSLGLIGHEAAVPILERFAEDQYKIGESFVVHQFAVLALGMIRSQKSVKALSKFVEDEDPVVRWHVAVALGNIGLKSGIALLAKLVNDSVPFTRAHTAIALGQIGDKSGRVLVKKLTKDKVDRVARISKDALKLLLKTSRG